MLMFFFSLSITPLATVAALSFTAPLFATLLAMLILPETVRLRRWTAILIGFAGALVILRPVVVEIGLGPILVRSDELRVGKGCDSTSKGRGAQYKEKKNKTETLRKRH